MSPAPAGPSPVELLLALLDEGFERKAWHGPNLRGSIRGLTASQAAWRPAEGRHCVWEIAVHAAYWKYAVRRQLTGEKRGTFPHAGSNWFTRPGSSGVDEVRWREDVALLVDAHRRLREAVAAIRPAGLALVPQGSKHTCATLVRGIASHDLYHAGQVQLLKRLMGGGR